MSEWGWLSTYPQALYYAKPGDVKQGIVEQITVGVAQNHNYELGMLSAMSGNNVMGRSYTHDNQTRYETEGRKPPSGATTSQSSSTTPWRSIPR